MNQQLYINNFSTVLAAALSNVATQMTLAAGQGDILRLAGVGSDGDYVRVELTQAGAETSYERIYITSVVGDVANILRNRDGNKPAAWASGSKVRNYNRTSQHPPIVATPSSPNTLVLEEGQNITITSDRSALGTITMYAQNYSDIEAVYPIAVNSVRQIGPLSGNRRLIISLTAGSVSGQILPGVNSAAIMPPGSDTGGVNSVGTVNSVGAAVVTVRPITNALPNAPYDSSTFRQIFQVPVKGKCLVRAVMETTTATATTIDAVAISAGQNYSNDDPVKADGSGGDWTVFTNVAVSAASATAGTDGLLGTGRTPWVLVDIPAPTDSGLGGYIYTGVKLTGGTRLSIVGNGGNRSISNYEQYISPKVPAMKYRGLRKSGMDFVNSNQNNMGANTPLYLSEYCPITHIEIAPVTRVISIAHFGDSTGDGLGTGTPLVQPNHYNWALIGANKLMQEQGVVISVSNFCHEGKNTVFNIQNRLGTLLADPEFCPSAVIIQPFSINDGTLTKASVDAAITIALTQALAARKRGIIPIFRTVIPSAGQTLTTDAFRKAGNDAIRASGELVIDIDALVTDNASPARLKPEYSLDGTHMSALGNEDAAPAFIAPVRKIFFV